MRYSHQHDNAYEIIHSNSSSAALSLALQMESIVALKSRRESGLLDDEIKRSCYSDPSTEKTRQRRNRRRRSRSRSRSITRRLGGGQRDRSPSTPVEVPKYVQYQYQSRVRKEGAIDWTEEGQEVILVEKEIYVTSSKQLRSQGSRATCGNFEVQRSMVLLGPGDVPTSNIRYI